MSVSSPFLCWVNRATGAAPCARSSRTKASLRPQLWAPSDISIFPTTSTRTLAHALDIPSYIADTLRELAGPENVVNATDLLMHPGYGLRAKCTPFEIAYFEYTNGQAAESVKRMIFALREGMTDHSVVESGRLNGDPLSCHVTFVTGRNASYGLCGPSGELIRWGQPLAFNVAYWGSNICRAGWIAKSAADLPDSASDYVPSFAGPYFEAMSEWFGLMKLGTPGHSVYELIQDRLPFDKFGIYLNPGHLIHLDEWMSSPFYPGLSDSGGLGHGYPGRRHPAIQQIFLHPHGRRPRDCRRGAKSEAERIRSGLLRPMPEETVVYEGRARH